VRKVFADTGYWVALVNPHDDLHQKALDTARSIGPVFTVTSDPVLTELLNDFGQRGPQLRQAAAELADQLRRIPIARSSLGLRASSMPDFCSTNSVEIKAGALLTARHL